MSAFIVTNAHIHAIVHVAILGPKNAVNWHQVYFGNPSHKADVFNADKLGQMLLNANYESVASRYPHHAIEAAPVYRFPAHLFTAGRADAVVYLKALQCYEYQACEPEGWDASPTKRFCEHLTSALISQLPGWESVPWGLDAVPTANTTITRTN